MNDDYTVEEKQLATQWYVYPPGCTYDQRGPVVCVLTITYSHQGTRVYITGVHEGKVTMKIRGAVKRKAAALGVCRIEWEHKGRIRTHDLY